MLNRNQGDKLRCARESSGFTQQQVASALNIDRSTYASYEIGRSQPNATTLVMLSKIFNTPIEELLDDELTLTYVQDIGRDKFSSASHSYTGTGVNNRYLSTLPRSSHIYDLSKDEHAILCLYRAASKEMRKEIIDYAESLLHQKNEKQQPNENPENTP